LTPPAAAPRISRTRLYAQLPRTGPETLIVRSHQNPRIAIVDDDTLLRPKLAAALRDEFDVLEGDNYKTAYKLLQEAELDVLLLGVPMASGGVKECAELLQRLDGSEIDTLVIALSSDQKKSTALKIIDAGCYDYFLKPIDADVLRHLLGRAVEKLRIQRENRILREEVSRKKALGDLVGAADSMRHVFEGIKRMARATASVIIRGESGVGKELVARAIHEHSPRRNRPFVSVNCAALPEALMEAELFGYEMGAFTGAVSTKEGRIELAQGGTLFLDEIATLTPSLQSKLLRVLEDHSLTRLGGKKAIRVDFRLISATNGNLEDMVRGGQFREDLYYRIQVVPIFVPALRERLEDIPVLAEYFVTVYCTANQVQLRRISDEAMQALKNYPWPGNVRELENVVQRLILMSDEPLIQLKDLPTEIVSWVPKGIRGQMRWPSGGISLERELAGFEKRCVQEALQRAKNRKVGAARLLGVDRNRISYLCRKHNL
jgi:DNA-binding NtrC family response regulator